MAWAAFKRNNRVARRNSSFCPCSMFYVTIWFYSRPHSSTGDGEFKATLPCQSHREKKSRMRPRKYRLDLDLFSNEHIIRFRPKPSHSWPD